MIISVVFIYCALQILFNYSEVYGEEDPFHRFFLEEGFKPPIFGSFNYDPINETFQVSAKHSNMSQIVNDTYVLSTALGIETETVPTLNPEHRLLRTSGAVYRHHASILTDQPTQWWARKLPNITKIPRIQIKKTKRTKI